MAEKLLLVTDEQLTLIADMCDAVILAYMAQFPHGHPLLDGKNLAVKDLLERVGVVRRASG